MPTAWVVSVAALMASGDGALVSCRTTIRKTPIAIIRNALPRNRYVGTAKMLPASRRPRRLAIVISAIAPTPMPTAKGASAGTAEVICSTADEVETATVRL